MRTLILHESRLPGLCWHCGHGACRVAGVECQQWKATKPVAVLDCRVFLEMSGREVETK